MNIKMLRQSHPAIMPDVEKGASVHIQLFGGETETFKGIAALHAMWNRASAWCTVSNGPRCTKSAQAIADEVKRQI
nr:hypothetical protein [uncultured Rhodoferax sp.]